MPTLSLPLSLDGPIIEVAASITRSRRYVLTRIGLPVPEPFRLRALIDTGATYSCLDASVFAHLDISPKGTLPILSPTTGATLHALNFYDVNLELFASPSQRLLLLEDFPVLEAALAPQGIHALIGRDILNQGVFVYDGQANSFSLSF